MSVWVFQAPQPSPTGKPLYLARVDDADRISVTHHAITAKRFFKATHAREWAATYADALEDWKLVRAGF